MGLMFFLAKPDLKFRKIMFEKKYTSHFLQNFNLEILNILKLHMMSTLQKAGGGKMCRPTFGKTLI